MKTLLTVILAATLFTSCTKEGMLPKLPIKLKNQSGTKTSMHFSNISGSIVASVAIEHRDTIHGEWDWDGDFTTGSQPNYLKLFFYDWGTNPDFIYPKGIMTLDCELSKGKLELQTYTGVGKWVLAKTEGTFTDLKEGAGILSWSESDYTDHIDDTVDLEGYFKQ